MENLITGAITEIGMKIHFNSDIIPVKSKKLESLNIISEVILFNKLKNVITHFSNDHNRRIIIDLSL